MFTRFLSFFLLFSCISITLLDPTTVVADYRDDLAQQLEATAGTQGANFGEAVDPRIAVSLLIRNALTLVGTLMLAYMVWAGFTWMTAAGADDKIDKAKKAITRSVIGLIIILSAYAITLFVTRLVDLRDGPATQRSGIYKIKECITNQDCPGNGTCSNNICSNGPIYCSQNNECPAGAVCTDIPDVAGASERKRCYDLTNQVEQIDLDQQRYLNPGVEEDATPFVL